MRPWWENLDKRNDDGVFMNALLRRKQVLGELPDRIFAQGRVSCVD